MLPLLSVLWMSFSSFFFFFFAMAHYAIALPQETVKLGLAENSV